MSLELLEQLQEEAERIRVDLDHSINSGDGVPSRWWLAEQYRELERVEEEIRGIQADEMRAAR